MSFFVQHGIFFFINLTKCSAPGGIKFLILIFIWSTFWEKTAWNIFILNECEWFFGNTPQQTLNNWNFQDKKSIYVSQYHCNVMTRAKWKGWPEYSSASPRPRRAVMSTSQRWKLLARPNLHAGICSSLPTTPPSSSSSSSPPGEDRRQRQRQGHHPLCEPARTNSSLLRQEDRHVVYWQKYTAVLTQFSKGGIDQWMKYIFRSKANFLTANSLHWPSFGENCTWVNDCFISVPTKFRKCRSHISAKDHTEDCNSVCV